MSAMAMATCLFSISSAATTADTCAAKCKEHGHCCEGTLSSCQKPSCEMGCVLGEQIKAITSEALCNASCAAAKDKCDYTPPGQTNITFEMCGSCPARWQPPASADSPWWPPGYALPGCGSCDDQAHECELGCHIAFNPSYDPGPPPKPAWPPAESVACPG